MDADTSPGAGDVRAVGRRPARFRLRQPSAAGAQARVRVRRAGRGGSGSSEQERWNKILAEHAERGDFVVQEYVPVPEEMFPTVEDGHVQMRLKRFNINPFGIGAGTPE